MASGFWAAITCTWANMPGSKRGSEVAGTILASNVCARVSPAGARVTTLAGNISPGYAGTLNCTSRPGWTWATRDSSTVTCTSTPVLANVMIGDDGVANAPAVSARVAM